jgi:hypothetical protein
MKMRRVGFWHDRENAWVEDHGVLHNQDSPPTHWMPLPGPPSPEGAAPPPAQLEAEQCQLGECLADDYFQHAAECASCEAYEAARVTTIRAAVLREPREAVRVLEEVRREIDEAEGTTGYDRSLVFEEARLMATEIISAKLAALRAEGEGAPR